MHLHVCGKWSIVVRLWKWTVKLVDNKREAEPTLSRNKGCQSKRGSFELFSTSRTLIAWKGTIPGLAAELVVFAVANVIADKIM